MEERRLRRIEIFRGNLFLERAAAKGDDAPAPVGDRKHDAVAEAVIGHRDIVAGNQEPGLDHVLDRDLRGAEMFLERVLLAGRVAEPELELRRGLNAAVGEIAAPARAGARGERRLEEFGGELDNVVQRLAALFARLGLARHDRHRDTGLPGQPLDRFGEAHALR